MKSNKENKSATQNYDFDKELEKLIKENESRIDAIKKIMIGMDSKITELNKTKNK